MDVCWGGACTVCFREHTNWKIFEYVYACISVTKQLKTEGSKTLELHFELAWIFSHPVLSYKSNYIYIYMIDRYHIWAHMPKINKDPR